MKIHVLEMKGGRIPEDVLHTNSIDGVENTPVLRTPEGLGELLKQTIIKRFERAEWTELRIVIER
jgi:hypothetical protein